MTSPVCSTAAPAGSISYQRALLPAPPAIVWFVQRAVFPCAGSKPDTACIGRPSSVSSTWLVDFCGAFGGTL